MSAERARNANFVQSLERGLAVIRAFDAEHRDLSLSEVARLAGLTRAAARRFLLTLVELGYVSAADGRFALSPRVLELGYAYLSGLTLPEVAEPHMEELVAHVNESSSISVLDDTEIVYVVRVPTRRIMSITLSVGTRLPAYATSMGRVLLAGLPDDELERRLQRMRLLALAGGANPRRVGRGGRCPQCLGPRQPIDDGGDAARLPATGARDRGGDRGRPAPRPRRRPR
jgi:IclR family pca regulon transcriptional regulator